MSAAEQLKTVAPVKLSLISKLAEVMGEIERIPKAGHNDFHNYSYATEADIVASVRAGLAKRHVMLVPTIKSVSRREAPGKNGVKTITTVEVLFTFHDGESGETLEYPMFGEGEDPADKGLYKALTGATKYALLKLFLIPTGDDPEATPAAPPPPQQRPRAAPSTPPATSSTPSTNNAGRLDSTPPSGPTFPNFGRAKGQPIHGADTITLEWYADAARKSLADPSKAKFHEKERANLAAIESELARQRAPAKTATADAKPRAIVDALPGESDEDAKMRQGGGFYARAVRLGREKGGWPEDNVKNWLKVKRNRSQPSQVTAEDVVALGLAMEPPEMGSAG